jgi:hypothetical protein
MDSSKTVNSVATGSSIRLQAYSIDASDISSRSSSTIRPGGGSPPAEVRSAHADERSDAARQPFQPVGHACDSSVLHAASTTRSETVLTARSAGTTGSRLR